MVAVEGVVLPFFFGCWDGVVELEDGLSEFESSLWRAGCGGWYCSHLVLVVCVFLSGIYEGTDGGVKGCKLVSIILTSPG